MEIKCLKVITIVQPQKISKNENKQNCGQKAVYVVGCSIVGPYEVYDIVGITNTCLLIDQDYC
jgi:hypothetical protein